MKLLLYQSALFLFPLSPVALARQRRTSWLVRSFVARFLPTFPSIRLQHRRWPFRAPFTKFTRLPDYDARSLRGISLYTRGLYTPAGCRDTKDSFRDCGRNFAVVMDELLSLRVLSYLTPAGIMTLSLPLFLSSVLVPPTRETKVSHARQIKFQEKRKGPSLALFPWKPEPLAPDETAPLSYILSGPAPYPRSIRARTPEEGTLNRKIPV